MSQAGQNAAQFAFFFFFFAALIEMKETGSNKTDEVV